MIDPISLSLAIGGVIISLVAYIKHSSCCRGAIEFDAHSQPITPATTTPLLPKSK